MPLPDMNNSTVATALAALADALEHPAHVETLLVGGAAGMLTGELPASRTTTDCDVMVYAPEDAFEALALAAAAVAERLSLARGWFNTGAMSLGAGVLPGDWRGRAAVVLEHESLTVLAAGRRDLIAMKVYAHRAQDLEDLDAMRVRRSEAGFVRAHLDTLGANPDRVSDARAVLDSLELIDG